MKSELVSIFLGFFEGFALIMSPCVLSILPIILASSLAKSKKRPMGIILGFSLTFALVGFFAHNLVLSIGIDINVLRYLAYTILFLLGVVMLSSYLTEKFTQITQKIANFGYLCNLSRLNNQDFLSGLVLGSLISLIWTPCAGPILAAVIVQIAIAQKTLTSFFILVAFASGASVPMLIICIYGLKMRDSFNVLKQHATSFRKLLGLVIILNMVYMISQEGGFVSSAEIPQATIKTKNYLKDGLWRPYQAPKIDGIAAWINSPPLSLADLKGKVVLVDFWTYSCINCVRTLPYLKNWYAKYHDQGLVIIGVHTPEFDFEKNIANVSWAVKHDGIKYPVAIDNQFITWNNFSNHYWPAEFLINQRGEVVYQHFGEGDDDIIENNIRYLLHIGLTKPPPVIEKPSTSLTLTPETYLGYDRANDLNSPSLIHNQTSTYHFPKQLGNQSWALNGKWQVNADKIIASQANAQIQIRFNAQNVFVVMGNSTATPINVKVLLNGQPPANNQGSNVDQDGIEVSNHSIYEVINLPRFGHGVLQLSPDRPGLEIYTFTFGG